MSLFDEGSGSTLADVLGNQAATATQGINDTYAKRKRKEAAIAGHTGRLTSGVQNYTVGDTAASQLGELGGVQGSLADALAGIPSQDYLGTRQDDRNRQLAELIASLQKPSDLESAFGALGSAGRIAGTVAAFG